jgi:probable F420-dependent oxidoreductase
MKLGLTLPNLTPTGNRQNVITMAREAERLGYDSLWVTDRLLYPVQPRQLMRDHPWPEVYRYALDPLDALIFAAGVTERIRLGTSLLDFPMYVPAPLAKRIATLDVLSGGRAVIGAGLGWSEDEYIASNVPFEKRGARMTEMIEAITALWGPDPVEFHGKFYEIPATQFNPKPLQKPRPPLLIGGYAPQALQRAARLADGFNPVAPPDANQAKQAMQRLVSTWQAAGRPSDSLQIVVRVNHGYIAEQPIETDRPFLVGSAEQVRLDVQQMAAWGVGEVFFNPVSVFGLQPDGFSKIMRQVELLCGLV